MAALKVQAGNHWVLGKVHQHSVRSRPFFQVLEVGKVGRQMQERRAGGHCVQSQPCPWVTGRSRQVLLPLLGRRDPVVCQRRSAGREPRAPGVGLSSQGGGCLADLERSGVKLGTKQVLEQSQELSVGLEQGKAGLRV